MKTCFRRSKKMTTRRFLRFFFFAITISALLLTAIPPSNADTFRPVVRGRRGVVAGGHPLSVEAGRRALPHGGKTRGARIPDIIAASGTLVPPFSLWAVGRTLIKVHGLDGVGG